MTSGSPPPNSSSGALDRLAELANHNRMAAMATVLTIVTGLAFLVNALRGGEEPVTRNMLLEAFEAARLRVEQASADAQPILRADGTSLEAPSVERQQSALAALRDAADAPAATEEERDRIQKALIDVSVGDRTGALRELERIALALEARGADADAADTWRHRSTLMRFSDPQQALADAVRADALHPGDASHLLDLAGMQMFCGDPDDGVRVARRAAAAAAAEGDRKIEAFALQVIANIGLLTSWGNDPDFERERFQAMTDCLALLDSILQEDPDEAVVLLHTIMILHLGSSFKVATPAWEAGRSRAQVTLAAVRDHHLEREALDPEDIDTAFAIAACCAGDATIRLAQGTPPADAVEPLTQALPRLDRIVRQSSPDPERVRKILWMTSVASPVLASAGEYGEALKAYELMEACARLAAEQGRVTELEDFNLGYLMTCKGLMLQALGQDREATRVLHDAMALAERGIALLPDPLIRAERRMVILVIASGSWEWHIEHADSLRWAEEAVRHYQTELVGTRREHSLIPGYTAVQAWRDELRARAEGEDAASDD